MSHSSGLTDGYGPDFHLPDEILAVIPTDAYEQLDLARKITSTAIASRVSDLESEMGRMRQLLYEKERVIYELEERVSSLDDACLEAESRLKDALDENMKLSEERDQLAMTAKRLSRDLTKLVTFKRQLMQSLYDDSPSQAEYIDIGTCDQTVPKAYHDMDERANGYVVHNSYNGSADASSRIEEGSRYLRQRLSITPYMTTRLTPTGTLEVISTTGSPRGYSPQRTCGAISPTKLPHEGRASLSSRYPSSQQSSAENSPPRRQPLPGLFHVTHCGHSERDGRDINHLSYEQFSAFLANIKELNAQKQTREETLRKAEDIFGTGNKDFFRSFQGLLNRNVH